MGSQATYIPALANVNPDQLGLCIETTGNELFCGGDADTRFSIQNISKVFSLAMALGIEGEDVCPIGHVTGRCTAGVFLSIAKIQVADTDVAHCYSTVHRPVPCTFVYKTDLEYKIVTGGKILIIRKNKKLQNVCHCHLDLLNACLSMR